jgi:hypothetical protein
MLNDPLASPVVIDGVLSDEKLSQLLGLRTEYENLDYKATLDPPSTEDWVEFAKDVGAMQVGGGYIVIGAAEDGEPTGALDAIDPKSFDDSRLTTKLRKWLPDTTQLRSRVARVEGHTVVLVYVSPNPAGCAFFRADGQYLKNGRECVAFRQGDVYWRDGTRSIRLSQEGFEKVVRRRIGDARSAWFEEQQSIRSQERAELQAAYQGRRLSEEPLGSLSFDLHSEALVLGALEMVRHSDSVGIRYLLNEAVSRARALIKRRDVDPELGDLLDKLTCLAAAFLEYELPDCFNMIIQVLSRIYSMPLAEGDAQRFGYATSIDPKEIAPRVWLAIIERVVAVGALAVRREQWQAVRALTLQRPDRLTGYDANWLRHTLTMASRAKHLEQTTDTGGRLPLNILSLARDHIVRLACLRPDGLGPDDEEVITSLAQFDLLWNLIALDQGDTRRRTWYPSFARFRQDRIQPLADRLISEPALRAALFTGGDESLAEALFTVGEGAAQEAWMYDGFEGWGDTPVASFIVAHRHPTG